ncbi:CPBP family intramembrane glutamic endopeptidase [Estrella lausannensis]|uniref:Protease n=1 Tax=Estrella lausannensis TaxID=483423 RepID=A0A0H5DTH9_9BACT|nr:CPBP family intramembrane glutamic endopeptidase [Estrella lausannensis]CRX39159.1 Protease [Estrella lausannensis]
MGAITRTDKDIIYIDSTYQPNHPPAAESEGTITEIKTEKAWHSWALSAAAAAGTCALSYLDFYVSSKIERIASQKLGICLGNFVSKSGIEKFAEIMTPLIKTNKKIVEFIGDDPIGKSMFSGALEEIEFRWFVQGVLLKRIPAKILKVISPGLEKWIDSIPAKITRIAAVALLFGFAHLGNLDCKQGGAISPLIGGVLYGTLYETAENPLILCMNMHMLYNLYCELS